MEDEDPPLEYGAFRPYIWDLGLPEATLLAVVNPRMGIFLACAVTYRRTDEESPISMGYSIGAVSERDTDRWIDKRMEEKKLIHACLQVCVRVSLSVLVFVCVYKQSDEREIHRYRGRERGRDRERERETHTHTHTHAERERERDGDTHTQRDRDRD